MNVRTQTLLGAVLAVAAQIPCHYCVYAHTAEQAAMQPAETGR